MEKLVTVDFCHITWTRSVKLGHDNNCFRKSKSLVNCKDEHSDYSKTYSTWILEKKSNLQMLITIVFRLNLRSMQNLETFESV